MNTYFLITQINDRKNEGQTIAATYRGSKIGFPFEALGDYCGIYEATKIVEKENHFKFGGRKVECQIPSFEAFYIFCEENKLIPHKLYQKDGVMIIRQEDDGTFYITQRSYDGAIVPVEPFTYAGYRRNGLHFYVDGLTENTDYITAYEMKKQEEKGTNFPQVIGKMIPMFRASYLSKYMTLRYYERYNLLAEKDAREGDSVRFVGNLTTFPSRFALGKKSLEMLEDETRRKNYAEYKVEDIRKYCVEHFIGKPYRKVTDHVGVDELFCCGNSIELYMFDIANYDPDRITDEEIDMVQKSKKKLEDFRKMAVKKLGTKAYLAVADSMREEAVLRL